MDSIIAGHCLQYAGIAIEACLVFIVAQSRCQSRLSGVVLYLSCLLAAGLGRAFVLHRYGLTSAQYSYLYWTTDFLLVIAAFVLVCLFFRRACFHQERMWRHVRLLLFFIFTLVVGISGISFLRHYGRLSTLYIVEFSQDLYFACLVLNTLLYLMLQQIESTDDQLGLLVCGVGIQFAGPAATMALLHLTIGERFAASLNSFTLPVCTLGMLLVWAYAILHIGDKAISVSRRENPVLAEASADFNV